METDLSVNNTMQVDWRDKLVYPLHQTGLHRFIVFILRILFRSIMVLEVEGLENFPNNGATILAANHLTSFDIFPLQLALPRPIFYMGKAELFRNPIVHLIFRKLGGFPVFRGERDEWAIKHAQRILKANQVLGMFPEGTRSHGYGLKVAKTGAARLALAERCPIVPVAIDGSQRFFKYFPRRTNVRIKVCQPIYPKPGELPLTLTDRLMFSLAENLPSRMRGVYAQVPEGFNE